jgi:hypothetical protein
MASKFIVAVGVDLVQFKGLLPCLTMNALKH